MKSLRLIAHLVFISAPFIAHAQTEVFDIVTYQPPQSWEKQTTDFAVSYSTVDQAAGTWAQMTIYKSVATSGDPATDFASEWKALVNTDTYAGAVQPAPQGVVKDEWTIDAGASYFTWQTKKATVMLTNISGFGVMMSILVASNSDKYMGDVNKFFSSLHLTKPEQPQAQVIPVTQPTQQATTTTSIASTIVVTDAVGAQGIVTATTNFDDGWMAQPFADYVKVTKPSIAVLLHYGIKINDEMRSADNMASAFWSMLIAPRYRTSNLKVFQGEMYAYSKTWFIEGDAVELSTGKTYYLGLRVLVSGGIASCIEIISPSAGVFQKEFPDQAKIEAMMNYNKFAVSAGDLVGTWEESTSSGMDLYNSVTGAYAGMSTTAGADSFALHVDGSYDSNHKGAFGTTGNLKFFDQKYHGKYTSTNWDVTMTNRFEGKTDVFWCQYEAVRGGRLLRLRDKVASGIVYSLVKTK